MVSFTLGINNEKQKLRKSFIEKGLYYNLMCLGRVTKHL